MPKVPQHPDLVRLRSVEPEWYRVEPGEEMWRVYFRSGEHPSHWSRFRTLGPIDARFDHQLAGRRPSKNPPRSDGQRMKRMQPDCEAQPRSRKLEGAADTGRAVMYLAPSPVTCLAEIFQKTRTIHRTHRMPALVGFAMTSAVQLLDLTGAFATRIGASMGLVSGARSVSRNRARGLYARTRRRRGSPTHPPCTRMRWR